MTAPFSGSYAAGDVEFLLKRLDAVATLGVADKERHIQGGGHYSEVLSAEAAPDEAYEALFRQQLTLQAPRMARHLYRLAQHIRAHTGGPDIALVSLARAGTPVGVLLKRILVLLGVPVTHYSVSIVRDRGLDLNALDHIRQRHGDESVVFVDGWTGKGVIGQELRASVKAYNLRTGARINPALHVVADIAGTAAVCATHDDYLLPSAILNATVSGLVSRTVLDSNIGPADFHGCRYLEHLASHDRSQYFIDRMWRAVSQLRASGALRTVEPCLSWAATSTAPMQAVVEHYRRAYDLPDANFVKPGVGEATRVMLRRVPSRLVVRQPGDESVAHLLHLAALKGVPVLLDPSLPCKALALIAQLD